MSATALLRRWRFNCLIAQRLRPPPGSPNFLAAAQEKLADAFALMDQAVQSSKQGQRTEQRVLTGPRELFQLVLSGNQIEHAEVSQQMGQRDTDELAADISDVLRALTAQTKRAMTAARH